MRDLTTLGVKRYGMRPFPVFTASLLQESETVFPVKLPSDYIEFIRFANGGVLDACDYKDPSTGGLSANAIWPL
jgi:hypothetical protein